VIDVPRFLTQFFGEGNDFSLPPTWRTDDRYARLAAFVDDLGAVPTRPVLLPRGDNRRRYIYAKAFSAAMGRRLAEALAAFVGPTYSHFAPAPVAPRPGDQVEAALHGLGPGPMWRLEVPDDHWRAAWDALGLLRTTWLDRPVRNSDDVVPVGRLLRDFRISLISADEHLSAACLERLIASGAFDAANIAFMKVRRHDALGCPERALDGAEIDDLFRMRLPAAVREALLVAMHRRHLATAAAAACRSTKSSLYWNGVCGMVATARPIGAALTRSISRPAASVFSITAAGKGSCFPDAAWSLAAGFTAGSTTWNSTNRPPALAIDATTTATPVWSASAGRSTTTSLSRTSTPARSASLPRSA
jgi:hypothetical protein